MPLRILAQRVVAVHVEHDVEPAGVRVADRIVDAREAGSTAYGGAPRGGRPADRQAHGVEPGVRTASRCRPRGARPSSIPRG